MIFVRQMNRICSFYMCTLIDWVIQYEEFFDSYAVYPGEGAYGSEVTYLLPGL